MKTYGKTKRHTEMGGWGRLRKPNLEPEAFAGYKRRTVMNIVILEGRGDK
jgi:hypothetical protein